MSDSEHDGENLDNYIAQLQAKLKAAQARKKKQSEYGEMIARQRKERRAYRQRHKIKVKVQKKKKEKRSLTYRFVKTRSKTTHNGGVVRQEFHVRTTGSLTVEPAMLEERLARELERLQKFVFDLIGAFIEQESLEAGDKLMVEFKGGTLRSAINLSAVDVAAAKEAVWAALQHRIQQVLQSNEAFVLDAGMIVTITAVRKTRGQGYRKVDSYDSLVRKNGYTVITGIARCLPKAILVGHAHEWGWNNATTLRKKQDLLDETAIEWCEEAGVDASDSHACDLEDAQRFVDRLRIELTVVTFEPNGEGWDFSRVLRPTGVSQEAELKCVYIHWIPGRGAEPGHFNSILTKHMGSMLNMYMFCHHCKVGYKEKYRHRCPKTCYNCHQADCGWHQHQRKCNAAVDAGVIDSFALRMNRDAARHIDSFASCTDCSILEECKDCHRNFPKGECFDNHLKHGVCTELWRCKPCHTLFRTSQRTRHEHVCGEFKCMHCNVWDQRSTHVCYMKPSVAKKAVDGRGNDRWVDGNYIFWDVESTCRLGAVHDAVLVCAVRSTGERYVLERRTGGGSAINRFAKWAVKQTGCTFVSHNGKGYDHYHLIRELRRIRIKYDTIEQGTKVLYITAGGKRGKPATRWIDNL